MVDNIHPVVGLLAARMESHPEEFHIYDNSTLAIGGRWETWLSQIRPFMNETEREMLFGKVKEVFLQRVHEEVLDELLNGPERRAEEKRARELEAQRMMAQMQAQSLKMGQYAQTQSLGALQNSVLGGIANPTGLYASQPTHTLQLGSEKLDEGMLRKIKKAMGL